MTQEKLLEKIVNKYNRLKFNYHDEQELQNQAYCRERLQGGFSRKAHYSDKRS